MRRVNIGDNRTGKEIQGVEGWDRIRDPSSSSVILSNVRCYIYVMYDTVHMHHRPSIVTKEIQKYAKFVIRCGKWLDSTNYTCITIRVRLGTLDCTHEHRVLRCRECKKLYHSYEYTGGNNCFHSSSCLQFSRARQYPFRIRVWHKWSPFWLGCGLGSNVATAARQSNTTTLKILAWFRQWQLFVRFQSDKGKNNCDKYMQVQYWIPLVPQSITLSAWVAQCRAKSIF